MLYTRKGDNGTTRLLDGDGQAKTFGCDQRISKSSVIAEALGALDEINSFLGLCKIKARKEKLSVPEGASFEKILHNVQKNLFIIQAEIAGSKMSISKNKVKEMEKIIDAIEKELPQIKNFFITGGCKLSALFDIARTISRRAERRVINVSEERTQKIGENTLAYLNRLSSLLYALARLSNHFSGIKEEPPDYQ